MRIIIVGGGIVGLATARTLAYSNRNVKVTLLEKENKVAAHQSGRNSGVIHSGIYYKPGSLKALNCRRGKQLLEKYCGDNKIPFERCGKIIVAVTPSELPQLQILFERGQANGVDCRMIDEREVTEIEPHAQGIAGLHVPETGIVDYKVVADHFVEDIQRVGGNVLCGTTVMNVKVGDTSVEVFTPNSTLYGDFLVNCAGLYSDKIASLCGVVPPCRIVPFRGEYFNVSDAARHLCRGMIYPVPDPQFPFLGVHVTKTIDGLLECGPNAVLAFCREGYGWFSFSASEFFETVGYRGFRTFAMKHWKNGLLEMYRSLRKGAFVKAVQRLVPDISSAHLSSGISGVRAQAVAPNGMLIDDFLIINSKRSLHVLNAPSPAATSCMSIGETISESVTSLLG